MERSLFFNALPDESFETGYDRNYNADDISDWLSACITTGVIKSTNGLQVLANTGMTIRVNAGKAVINGKPYINDNYVNLTVPTAPTGSISRKDAIVLRLDKTINNRNISIKYIPGDNLGNLPTLQRTATIYELMLAYITVKPNVTSISQSDIKDLRGDSTTQITLLDGSVEFGYCPYITMVKGYDDYYNAIVTRFRGEAVVKSLTTTVVTDLASNLFKPATDLASVYLNGELVDSDEYTLSNSNGFVVVTFTFNVLADQKVAVVVDRFYDGEGLPNVLQDYLNLKQKVEAMTSQSEDVYVCNGVNDNVLLSEIAQTWLNGGTDYASKVIKVFGTLGITAPNSGDGTSTNKYKFFNFGLTEAVNRKIIFDFSSCSQIEPTLTDGFYYTMFSGKQVYIKNASVVMNNTKAYLLGFDENAQYIECDNCRFWINGLSNSYIARTGVFANCRGSVMNVSGNSYCYYVATESLLRVVNGEYYAYAVSGAESAVVWFANGGVGVGIMENVSCPTLARSGYVQSRFIQHTSGGYARATNTITMLPAVVQSTTGVVVNTIPFTKQSLM